MTPFHIASFRLVNSKHNYSNYLGKNIKILTHSLQAMNLATSSFFVGETQRKEPFNPSLHTKTVSGNST